MFISSRSGRVEAYHALPLGNTPARGGKPCIRGLRLSVQRVLEILAQIATAEDLHEDYPDLEPEDIRQALLFAAAS
jgi:uncharacterized protein (DUF433 family)